VIDSIVLVAMANNYTDAEMADMHFMAIQENHVAFVKMVPRLQDPRKEYIQQDSSVKHLY
jgi:hypothetical protein